MLTAVYFSGTGNTRFCAERFVRKQGGRAFPIEDKSAVSALAESSEIVLAYPIYYSNIPVIIRDFIKDNAALWHGKRVFIIVTMGAFSGDGTGCSARILRKLGASITGGLHVKMPDCIGDVKLLKKPLKKNKEIVEKAERKIDGAAKKYRSGKPPRDGLNAFAHIAGLFGQRLWFRGKTKDYTQNPKIDRGKCVGCGVCKQLCPMNNIQLENGKAAAGDKCTLCYRCFSKCPQKAITIIGKEVITQYDFRSLIDNVQRFGEQSNHAQQHSGDTAKPHNN